MFRLLLAAIALLCTSGAAARTAEPIVLAPTTDWILDYAPERCSLTRGFGEGENAVRIQIDSYGNLEGLRVLLAGPAVPESQDPSGRLSVQMTPDKEPRQDIFAVMGKTGLLDSVSFSLDFLPAFDMRAFNRKNPDEQRAFRRSLRPLRPDFENETRSLTVRFNAWEAVELSTGRMTGPLTALRDCTRDLWASWGIDPDVQEGLSRPPVVKDNTLARIRRNYPAAMIGHSALAPVRITVAADGTASDCVVQSEVVPEVGKAAVCQGLAAEFEPAHDAAGQPVRAIYHTQVFFRTFRGSRSRGAGIQQ